jgi:hypothetical protein
MVEFAVLQNLFEQLRQCDIPARTLQSLCATNINALEALCAASTVQASVTIDQLLGMLWTDQHTVPASGAALPEELKLNASIEAFGIMTPGAAQRAAFEKNRGAYSRAIIAGEALDMTYTGLLHDADSSVLWMISSWVSVCRAVK